MIDKMMAALGYVPRVRLKIADDTLREEQAMHNETLREVAALRDQVARQEHQLESVQAELRKVQPPVTAQQLRQMSIEANAMIGDK